MNSTMMQCFLNLGCHVHKIVLPRRGDMYRGDNFCLGQLPDVELVQGEDALDLKDRFTNFAERNVGGNALKEDVCGASDYSTV